MVSAFRSVPSAVSARIFQIRRNLIDTCRIEHSSGWILHRV
jgi:hypothetical protein